MTTIRDDSSSPQRENGKIRWFAAMEYYALILNRTFKVFITDHMLCGAKVRGIVASPTIPSPQMSDESFWVETPSERASARFDPESKDFLELNPANFQIKWSEIGTVEYIVDEKWDMGNIPHSRRLIVKLRSGRSREFILLGEQDGDALARLVGSRSAAAP